jgi:hypothetical protein
MPPECPVMKSRYHLYPADENFHFCVVDFTFFHGSFILVPMKLTQNMVKVKVKQSRYRPGVVQRVPGN